MHIIPNLLSKEQVCQVRQALEQADWTDGRVSAGHQALKAKHNLQLDQEHPVSRQVGDFILERLGGNPRFMATALPLKVFPPRFNRYQGGGHYGNHIDSAVLSVPGTPHRVRGDISATLFLCDPDAYDGGELIIEDTYGSHSVKLPAGDMVLYPGTSLHRVTPVTRGARLASFFWVQSLVREDSQRGILLNLDDAIQNLTLKLPDDPALAQLTGVYHNLLRQWSNT